MDLQRIEIGGHVGMLAYFDADFQMTDAEHAVLAKVVFDDGTPVFYAVSPLEPHALYSADQERDEKGQWTTGGASHEARRQELGVPPNWRQVQVNKDRGAELQAKGIDAKGRAVYLYSAEHAEKAAAEKFARLKEFNKELPDIRARIAADLKDPMLSQPDREAASALALIDKTGFRVGSDTDTKAEKQAYGATTLTSDHVTIKGDTVSFAFVGKKGVDIEKTVKDPELARMLAPRVAAGGKLFDTTDARVRDYLHARDGDFKVKDFRTWHGTTKALETIKSMPVPKTSKEYDKARATVGDRVAAHLGNTRAVALSSYIDPAVFSPWKHLKS